MPRDFYVVAGEPSTSEWGLRRSRGKSLTPIVSVLSVFSVLLLGAWGFLTGSFGSTAPAHAIDPPPSDPVVTLVDRAGIEITQRITKTSGDPALPARAGDVLQYHVAVHNVSGETFTAEDPLKVSLNVSGLDAHGDVPRVHAGTNANYCGPTSWRTSGSGCAVHNLDGDRSVTIRTALRDGARYYVNVQVKVGNAFEGDRTLTQTVCIDTPLTTEEDFGCLTFQDVEIEPTYGDIEVTRELTRISPRATAGPIEPGDVIRAGDLLQYHVAVRNTGEADWTAPAGATLDKRLTFATDLSALADDAVIVGARQGTSRSSSYCGPTGWGTSGTSCAVLSVNDDATLHHTFALAAGGTRYFNTRIQVRNDFAGDGQLTNLVTVSGDTRGPEGVITRVAESTETVAEQYPDIEVTRELTRISPRGTEGLVTPDDIIRAGDLLQYHVRVTNTGDGDWTAPSTWAVDKQLTFESDLGDLADDAVIIGARQGTSGTSYYCGPDGWNSGNASCDTLPVEVDDTLSHSFSLNAGASHYFNVRVQVSNDYSGDLALAHTVTVSGDTQGDDGVITRSSPSLHPVAEQYPDIEITRQWNKIRGDSNGPIRAGDLLQYHVVVSNTGDGDWTAPTAWAEDKRLTFTTDLGDLADDAVIIGARQGTSGTSYYCGPDGWNSGNASCNTLPISHDNTLTHTFALQAGRSHYFNVRVQITNDYTGDLTLANTVTVRGDARGPLGMVQETAESLEHIDAQYPAVDITRQWTKVSGDADAPIRPGDILQLHAVVTNTGDGDWTAPQDWALDKQLTFSTDLGDLADDAVIIGARQGTSGSSYYCGPDGWNSGNASCNTLEVLPDNTLSHTFPLRAGVPHYFNVRVQVRDHFGGDEVLLNSMCVSGDSMSVHGVLTTCADEMLTVTAPEPDLRVTVTADTRATADRDARPGDLIDYRVSMHNPGEGDWVLPSSWAIGSPVSLEMDLSDILDDGEWVRGEIGSARIDPVDGVLSWQGALASGHTRHIDFTVRAKNIPDEHLTDRLMLGEACASGSYRHATGAVVHTRSCDDVEVPITEFWQMQKSVFDDEGNALDTSSTVQPGDELTFVTSAAARGGWPLSNVQLTDDLTEALAIGELTDDIVLSVPGQEPTLLSLDDQDRVQSEPFVLPGYGEVSITYSIQIPVDAHRGILRTSAVGTAVIDSVGERAPAICGSLSRPCATEHRIVQPAPLITKTAVVDDGANDRVTYGSRIVYTVTAVNPGPGVWTHEHPLSLVDDLSDVLDNAALEGDPGAEVVVSTSWQDEDSTISAGDGRISWSGAVPAGGEISLTYSVRVHNELPRGVNRSIVNEACVGIVGAERACDEVRHVLPIMTLTTPETPASHVECVAESWIDLPVTPGLRYTIEGEVRPGSTIVVTATAHPGFAPTIPEGWIPSTDGRSATLTIHYPPCDGEGAQFAYPVIDVHSGSCDADPRLSLRDTAGVAYEVEGDIVRGSTVTVTATADVGYLLASSGWQRWIVSGDRASATFTITFPDLECADGAADWRGIVPELPNWGGSSCHFGGVEPWFELPYTEGLHYEIADGNVARGSHLTIHVTAIDGEPLGHQWYWRYSDDRLSATYTVHFPELGDCSLGSGPEDPDDQEPGDGEGENGDGSGPQDDDSDEGSGDPHEPPPGNSNTVIDEIPEPAGGVAQCVDGEPVVTDLRVRAVPGVWYEITGEHAPGGTLVLTAYAEDGYEFADMNEWASGEWVIAADSLTAVRTYVFPPAEELCEPWTPGQPEEPGVPEEPLDPVEPVDPVDPVEPVDPVDPEQPEEPVDPEIPSEPTDPSESADPTEPTEPAEPTDPAEPTEPTEPAEPVEPTEPTEPADPVIPEPPVDSEDPHVPQEPELPDDPLDPVNPDESEDAEESADPEDPVDSQDSNGPTKPEGAGDVSIPPTAQPSASGMPGPAVMPETAPSAGELSVTGDGDGERRMLSMLGVMTLALGLWLYGRSTFARRRDAR